MKKRLTIITLLMCLLMSFMMFTACAEDLLYGEYSNEAGTVKLTLTEDSATFGSYDQFGTYYVNYSDSENTIGISADSWECYWGYFMYGNFFWGSFDYTFTVKYNDGGKSSLTYQGYLPSSDPTVADEYFDIELFRTN